MLRGRALRCSVVEIEDLFDRSCMGRNKSALLHFIQHQTHRKAYLLAGLVAIAVEKPYWAIQGSVNIFERYDITSTLLRSF